MSIQDGQSYETNQVHYHRKKVTFSDDGTTVSVGWVPARALVIDAGVIVDTAFDAGTTNTLNIGFRNAGDGTADDADEFASLIALGTAGKIAADDLATAADLYFPDGAEITAGVVLTGTAATAGVGYVYVTYLADNTEQETTTNSLGAP